MIVNSPPCRSNATSRPNLNTYAAMKKPTTVTSIMSKTTSDLMPGFYHDTVSGFRKKD